MKTQTALVEAKPSAPQQPWPLPFRWRFAVWLWLFSGLAGLALAQEADSYLNRLEVTPNAFIAGAEVQIRVDLKQFSSFLYRGVFWQISFDGVRF